MTSRARSDAGSPPGLDAARRSELEGDASRELVGQNGEAVARALLPSDYDQELRVVDKAARSGQEDIFARWYGEVGEMVRNDGWDFVTGITGRPGVGKSTLGFCLMPITDPDFSKPEQVPQQVAFTPVYYIRLLRMLALGKTKMGDEWVNAGYKRNHSSRENKETNTAFMTLRGMTGGHHILNMPNLFSFDTYWRNERLSAWILVRRRGEAVVHVPVRNDYRDGEVFWRPVLRVSYPGVSGPVWDEYDRMKEEYMKWQAERALSVLEEAEEGSEGGRMSTQAEREARLRRIAQEVAARDDYFDGRGRVRRGMIDAQYPGMTDREIERAAGLAAALRVKEPKPA